MPTWSVATGEGLCTGVLTVPSALDKTSKSTLGVGEPDVSLMVASGLRHEQGTCVSCEATSGYSKLALGLGEFAPGLCGSGTALLLPITCTTGSAAGPAALVLMVVLILGPLLKSKIGSWGLGAVVGEVSALSLGSGKDPGGVRLRCLGGWGKACKVSMLGWAEPVSRAAWCPSQLTPCGLLITPCLGTATGWGLGLTPVLC